MYASTQLSITKIPSYFRFTRPGTNKVAYADLLKYLNYTTDPAFGSHGLAQVRCFVLSVFLYE